MLRTLSFFRAIGGARATAVGAALTLLASPTHGAELLLSAEGAAADDELYCDAWLKGEIQIGDHRKILENIEHFFGYTTLCLDSPGGNFLESLKVAKVLLEYGVPAVLEGDADCLSGCAFVFMAGTAHRSDHHGPRRIMHAGSTLGFHAPFLQMADLPPLPGDNDIQALVLEALVRDVLESNRRLLELLAVTEYDRYAITRRYWVKPSLVEAMLAMEQDSFFYVDTVGKVGNFDIELTGYRVPRIPIESRLRNICLNIYKWHRDVYAGNDIPIRPLREEDIHQGRFDHHMGGPKRIREMLFDEGAEVWLAEIEDGGSGGPLCAIDVGAVQDGAECIETGLVSYDREVSTRDCTPAWAQYHFRTELKEIVK